MAFDQATRNRLQSFVSSARNILSQEFTRQLQADYGMDPKQGTVADISTLTHLDNSQRQTAQLLRDTLEHYLATTPGKSDKERTKQVLERIIREQAFTVLNRLAALRMAEAREFLIESIGKSQSSKGFQLYRQLAGTSHGETGDAYRNYLFSLFDEFSVDLAVLFDRHSIQGRLFPRESALLELLAEINHQEIDALWAEDETIGWIYQYFNSQEERKKMRAESQAPRNSRELAVRNQFFTPRYVVEFLTDNTLGRIWYEMTQGNTALVDSCSYLVRRPTEIFLQPGEQAPDTESTEDETLSQEELLQKPVYIPHRKLKDPRSIRMLDPACGSMHFGLYAFDLFELIYLEAWQLEQELGPDAFQREANQQSLQASFSSLDELKTQIPKLIIENNIHGVDIDPRAVQIAGLSLWQRAQRAWQLQGVKPQQRPVIVRSNIVCAEPMPGDKALLKEFTSQLNPPVLGHLLEVIFDKMQLAGEAGTLLKIEEEIQTAIKDARNQWQQQSGRNSVSDMFQAELVKANLQKQLGFDLRGIDDATFWDDAERLILGALSEYANQAESSADQKRLFAEDAAKGFAFIDLCRKRFDVLLMNPPFGQAGIKSDSYIKNNYTSSYYDLGAAFISRALILVNKTGKYGLISNRTIFFNSRLASLRKTILSNSTPDFWVDLGSGVLDALVETSLLIASNRSYKSNFPLLTVSGEKNKDFELKKSSKGIYKIALSNDILNDKLSIFKEYQEPLFDFSNMVCESGFEVRQGLATGDNFAQIRLRWEVPAKEVNATWFVYSKGGNYAPYYYDPHLLIGWNDKSISFYRGKTTVYSCLITRNSNEYIFRPGLTYASRTSSKLSVRMHLEKSLFDTKGPVIFSNHRDNEKELLKLSFFLNSNAIQYLLDKETSASEGAARTYGEGLIGRIKLPDFNAVECVSYVSNLILAYREAYSLIETSSNFSGYKILSLAYFSERINSVICLINNAENNLESISFLKNKSVIDEINLSISNAYGLCEHDVKVDLNKIDLSMFILSYAIGLKFKRWRKGEHKENRKSLFSPVESYPPAYFEGETISILEGTQLAYELLNELGEDKIFLAIGESAEIKTGSYILPFFRWHLSQYSMSRRQAPIYWPLQTRSGSYTLWVYYHGLTAQTLYTCINDFVEPKLSIVSEDLGTFLSKTARSREEEKELAELADLEAELKDFRDELLRLAKFWKPNLNDGVQITAAPLWKLFQHKAWQKKLKDTWESLEDGDYDWAHLACSIWPERVLRKCHQDRSLAIAHDVEDIFWHEVEVPVKRGAKLTGEIKTEWQPKSLTATELTELINQTITDLK